MTLEKQILDQDTGFDDHPNTRSLTEVLRDMQRFFDAAIILVAPNDTITFFDNRTLDLFELPNSIVGKKIPFTDMVRYLAERGAFGPGDTEQFVALTMQTISNTKETPFQSYLTMPSGNILRVNSRRAEDGSTILTAIDVSEQRRKEDVLEMALNIGLAGYFRYNLINGTFSLESRYLKTFLTPDEMQSVQTHGLIGHIHPEDKEEANLLWVKSIKSGERQSGTSRILTQNKGVRWLRYVIVPETNESRTTCLTCFFNDISESVEQQKNLSKAKQLAEKSLQSKEDFLARMSHEVRTPMNAVIGISDALIHHHADDAINPKLELIQSSANSILKLLDETLTHSRLDSDTFALAPAPDSPENVVKTVCALWEQQALKNGNQIRCIVKDGVPDIMLFDKYRYEQCINNLLSNAVKFTKNGRIDVIMTTVTTGKQPPRLVLAVRDTGIGMTPEQQSKIFEAYTQADESISSRFGGTGLGMNITKKITESMDGSLSVRSEIGKGTLFALSVPIVKPAENTASAQTPVIDTQIIPETKVLTEDTAPVMSAAVDNPRPIKAEKKSSPALENPTFLDPQPPHVLTPPAQTQPSEVVPPPAQVSEISINETSTGLIDQMLGDARPVSAYSHLKILVVDDNSTNHLVIRSLLGSIVSEIHLASNGFEALDTLDNAHIDIVLMDIHMPIMDGIECTLAIRSSKKSWKDVLIIALTADPQYQQKKLCKNIGMDEALGKPVRLNDLLSAIDAVIKKAETSAADTHVNAA